MNQNLEKKKKTTNVNTGYLNIQHSSTAVLLLFETHCVNAFRPKLARLAVLTSIVDHNFIQV